MVNDGFFMIGSYALELFTVFRLLSGFCEKAFFDAFLV